MSMKFGVQLSRSVSRSAKLPALSLILLFGAAACTSTNTSAVLDTTTEEEFVDLRAYCPKLVVASGTETMRIYAKGVKKEDEGAAAQLRFQAIITEAVRECKYSGQFLNMRIGVAGRVINGPTGESGILDLPIMITVSRGETILYSQLHKIATNIEPSRNSQNFRFVDEAITLVKPEKENILVRVGFEEISPAKKGPKKKKRPIN